MKTNHQTTLDKNCVAKSIAFPLLVFLGLWTMQHVCLVGLRQYSTLNLGTWSKVASGKINADILVVGSSRAQKHFDSRILGQLPNRTAYNLGLDGTPIDLQAAFFFTYLRHNRKPEFLILSLDVNTLAGKRDGNVYHPGQYVAYLDQPDIFLALKHRSAEWTLYKIFPLIGIATCPFTSGNEQLRYEAIRGFFHRSLPEVLFNGFAPVNCKWTTEFDEYKKEHPNGVTYEIRPENTETMCEILTKCRQLGISPILVYSPEYFENQILTNNRNEIFSVYRDLADKYGVPLWDYSNSDISRDKENFYNSQHLNEKGAACFSEDLASRLQSEISACSAMAVERHPQAPAFQHH